MLFGNFALFSELFKEKMLPEKIICRNCITSLVDSIKELFQDEKVDVDSVEQEIEALCHLLTTVGQVHNQSSIPSPPSPICYFTSRYLFIPPNPLSTLRQCKTWMCC